MHWKRLVYFILLNILVSAATTLGVLTLWDRSCRTEKVGLASTAPAFTIPTPTKDAPLSNPEIDWQVHQVKAGETLGEIALAFDVSLEVLLEANGLTNPDEIGVGTLIYVPIPAKAPENNSTDSTPLEGSIATNTGQVEIVAIFGAGDLASERVQLRGLGESTLSLTGWVLQDEDGNEYIFPKITLFENGAVNVYSTVGVDTVVSLYWGSGQALWQAGETATLIDPNGNIRATYTTP